MIDDQLDKTQTILMKDILYKSYTVIDNKDAYNNVSKSLRDYLLKINNGILEEGFELWE